MKRSEIKRHPSSDTVIANLEVELKEYRELDGNRLYIRVKADGKKLWEKADGKWWFDVRTYPELSALGVY